jgi:hypothetical protein
LYSSHSIIRTIKSRRITWADHVANMREQEMHVKFWLENFMGRDPSGVLSIDGKMILKWFKRM